MSIQVISKICFALGVIILSLSSVSARNITFSYPAEVSFGEEFSVDLELLDFSEGFYDVKIDVLVGGLRVSEIENSGEWKSTNYYVLKSISPGEMIEFNLNITKKFWDDDPESSEANITVKIRNSAGGVTSYSGYVLEIELSDFEEESEEEDEDLEEDEDREEDEDLEEEEIKEEIKISEEVITAEPIRLEKDIKTWKSRTRYIKEYSLYGFTLFLAVSLILLMGYKKRKEKQEI